MMHLSIKQAQNEAKTETQKVASDLTLLPLSQSHHEFSIRQDDVSDSFQSFFEFCLLLGPRAEFDQSMFAQRRHATPPHRRILTLSLHSRSTLSSHIMLTTDASAARGGMPPSSFGSRRPRPLPTSSRKSAMPSPAAATPPPPHPPPPPKPYCPKR